MSSLEAAGRTLLDVAPDEWPALDPDLDASIGARLTPDASVALHDGHGGPGPDSIRTQLATIRRLMGRSPLTQRGGSGTTEEIPFARSEYS